MADMFGETPEKRIKRRGHAAQPGSGPAGKCCKDCQHYRRIPYHDYRWLKCGLMRHAWTHGAGSDIKAGDPACSQFEPKTDV